MNDGIKNYGQNHNSPWKPFFEPWQNTQNMKKEFCIEIPAFWIEPKIRNVKISLILMYLLFIQKNSLQIFIYLLTKPGSNAKKNTYFNYTNFSYTRNAFGKKCQVREYFMIHFYSNQQHDQQIISSAFKAKLYTI